MKLAPPDFSQILNPEADQLAVSQEIAEYCRIDLANLDIALERHPSLYAYTSACFEMAKVAEARAKWDLETTIANTFSIVMNKDSKMTATAAEKVVKTYPAVTQAAATHHEKMLITARMKGLANGLEHRRDMLVQISARQRVDMRNS